MSRLRALSLVFLLGGALPVDAARRDLEYERIEQQLRAFEADPEIGSLAPAESSRVRETLAQMKLAGMRGEEREHLSYLAERRLDGAIAAANAVHEERLLTQLQRERDQILLEASRRDAEMSRLEAEKLRLQSLARAEEAERARSDADAARAESVESAALADAARAEADQARRVAQAQSAEAELAKREAELAVAAADSLRMQMQSLTAREEARGSVMTLGEAVFAAGRSQLLPEAIENLDTVVDFVNRDVTRSVRIEGHTDASGSDNANQVLSQQRADAVLAALAARGVDAARMTAIGRGETVPVASNESAEGKARNRRVEIILLGR
ncbi:MAG: OmpA family protein [Xanthomonadales bacterium]|jgi:outer membrane protein OmpA-like peptidoglycan-associated protein|nr:OmpA family protein [Xanthomonadales bacterium]MBK7144598.1 OmpA family protein [Xanthomonadales bacterium]MCC6561901.1 OmpA family protein [Xanthomonadales bacterium]